MANNQPLLAPDMQALQDRISQRQQIAQQLLQRGTNADYSTQMAGGFAVKRSPLEALANIGSALVGAKMANQSAEDKNALAMALQRQKQEQFRSMYGGVAQQAPQPTAVPQNTLAQALIVEQPHAGNEAAMLIPKMQPQQQQVAQPSARQFVTGSYEGDQSLHAQNPEEYFKAWNAKNNPEFSTSPEFDEQGRAYVMNKAGGRQFIGSNRQEEIVSDNGVLRSKYGTQPKAVRNDPNKPFGYKLENGLLRVAPNGEVQGYELEKAERGSTKISMPVSVNTEKTYAGNVASGLAQKDIEDVDRGRSAIQAVGDAQNILRTLDSNKAIVGPWAKERLTIQQIGSLFGAKDDESLAQTRGMMQSMAKLVMQARKQMQGQGQITNDESKLAERTAAGDVNMTVPEIRVLAKAAERASRIQIKRAQSIQKQWASNPNMGSVGQDSDIYEPPAYKPQAPQAAAPGSITYNPKTGKWE